MCGIFGFNYTSTSGLGPHQAKAMMDHLFRYSQSRGKEASGILVNNSEDTLVLKDPVPGRNFIRRRDYRQLFTPSRLHTGLSITALGHARLDTQGSKRDNKNNSPLSYGNVYGIHNGIVINVDQLWQEHPDLHRQCDVDSEVLPALFQKYVGQGQSGPTALTGILAKVEGSASVALFAPANKTLTLGTNTGSLYFIHYSKGLFVFASEAYILEKFHSKLGLSYRLGQACMQQVNPGSALQVDTNTATHNKYQGRVVHAIL